MGQRVAQFQVGHAGAVHQTENHGRVNKLIERQEAEFIHRTLTRYQNPPFFRRVAKILTIPVSGKGSRRNDRAQATGV